MKTTILAIISLAASILAAQAAPLIYFGQDINTLPPVGPGADNPTRLTNHPNSDLAASQFRDRLFGVATETFEMLPTNTTPQMLTFGQDTATLIGSPFVYEVRSNTFDGTFPTSGNRYLLLMDSSPNFFSIQFSSPQAAFGFWATDIEVLPFRIVLVSTNGMQITNTVPVTLPQASGGVIFFGAIDTDTLFTSVEFVRSSGGGDGFGFDDMTIGRLEQVRAPRLSIRVSQVELCWDTMTNEVYQLQYRSSLTTNVWLQFGGPIVGDGSQFCTNDAVLLGQPQRFYQLVLPNSP